MKSLSLIIGILMVIVLITTPAERSVAEGIDCDQMVNICKESNPYHWGMQSKEYYAYNLGCMNAGRSCKTLQGELEVNEG